MIVFLLAILCCAATVSVFYPGYMSWDSVQMLLYARTSVPIDVYAPMVSYVWRIVDHVIAAPVGILILHDATYWLALALVVCTATSNIWLRIAFLLVAGFWPPGYALEGILWKDVGMRAFLLAATAFLMLAHRKQRMWHLGAAAFFLFMAVGYRQNAVAAALPLLVWWVVLLFRLADGSDGIAQRLKAWRDGPRRWLAYAIAFVALWFVTVSVPGWINSVGVIHGRVWTAALIHDLAGITVNSGVICIPSNIADPAVFTVEEMRHIYTPKYANCLFQPEIRAMLGVEPPVSDKVFQYKMDDDAAKQLVVHWVRMIALHPLAYLKHRYDIVKLLLVFPPAIADSAYLPETQPNPWGYGIRQSAANQWVMAKLQYLVYQTHTYDAWIYFVLLLACCAATFFHDFAWGGVVRILTLSAVLYFASILVFGVAVNFRYNIWLMTCSAIVPFLLACNPGPNKES